MASREVAIRAVTISGLRPMASEVMPENSMPMARVAVLIESGRLLTAGEMPNSRVNSGSSGWMS